MNRLESGIDYENDVEAKIKDLQMKEEDSTEEESEEEEEQNKKKKDI